MNEMATINQNESMVQYSPEQVLSQVRMIQDLMAQVMIKDQHYGTIPGTPKPTLYKAGAEKLNFTFRLAPKFEINKTDLKDGHREYEITCELYHINSGLFFGAGVGSCSTMEVKYRYRDSKRTCPKCGSTAIIKGKREYGGGWVCFEKKGGCKAKFSDMDPKIVDQKIGRMENPDLADQYNTVLKMAKKRALVDATITSCAASDIFTQDVEDMNIKNGEPKKNSPQPEPEPEPMPGPPPEQTKEDAEKAELVDKIKEKIAAIVGMSAPDDATPEEIRDKSIEILEEFSTWNDTCAKSTKELEQFSVKRLQTIYGKLKKDIEGRNANVEAVE